MKQHWMLDPAVCFLNHGSFGACPREVLAAANRVREELERAPIQFFVEELPSRLARVRARVGEFAGADPADLVFTDNATTGVNAVLRSLALAPGDELLTTDHTYAACRNALDFVAERSGARVVVARVPFPLTSAQQISEAVLAGVTPRTRLALIDHVTSITALVFPIADIVRELRARGVLVLVDGAHAPGMVPLELSELGADFYTANFHKWVCSPKGAAMLWVRRELQSCVFPLVISHGYGATDSRFHALFDWPGTHDPSAWLTIGVALDFMERIGGGFAALQRRNHAMALAARDVLCAAIGIAAPAPDDLIGSMASVPLPNGRRTARELYAALVERQFEVLLLPWPGAGDAVLRVSAQLYNEADDYRRLASALTDVLATA